ncbi:tRNA (cytidine(34)-2'-O)-methyltransferase [Pelagibacterium sp. H642]|uniref:tRNA (cytidine(34)-2'-O)-methyltransferase n=1 Tax=Pelagibacterium sp. H642 TaxID=1881069 RepID=UPI0028164E18|nr:tRNA (cytidine(34)-2'-O)-methyltransferase [Pelagibacterium sp. H642]WMT89678.1 tRNA (cytidine(34)-2'-O)-methyltransferase [Pelagibacterium sp. H642]
MPLALALYQPDIALNTGTLLRLGACLGVPVHIVHPTGFPFSRAALKRSGMDYLDSVEMVEHSSYDRFDAWRRAEKRRLVLLTTKASEPLHNAVYREGDILMVGRESAGVPPEVAADADLRIRIPMRPQARSLNVAISAALALGEAMRQTDGFAGLA